MARIRGLRPELRLPSAERDVRATVDDELAFHIDALTEELVRAGRAPEEARREALARFGDIESVRERCYELSTRHQTAMRRSDRVSSLWQDLAYAVRVLRRAPGFAVVVLLTLALGIGATTAMYSVVRGVLLRPLPFADADRVVRLWPSNPGALIDRGQVSVTELEDWERDLKGFAAVGAYRTFGTGAVFDGAREPSYAVTTFVSRGFFPALGTPAALGRTLRPAEHVEGGNHSVVVSHAFWMRELGGDPAAVGRAITLDKQRFVVVGVMPRDFAFPTADVAVWMSSSLLGEDDVGGGRDARWLDLVARLRPGVSVEQGRAQVVALQKRLAATYPESSSGWTAALAEGVRDSIVGPVRRGLLVLFGAVGLVMLLVCANVANLILVRGTTRERELALRAALGAGRERIVRLLLIESVLLSLIGGALGVLLAWWGVGALVALSGDYLPRARDVRIDGGVCLFALGVSALTGIACGLWPAMRASAQTRMAAALRDDSRGSVGSRVSNRARAALVAGEVALAVVLISGAGLMLRSFERLTAADPGFESKHALLVRFGIDFEGDRVALLAARTRVIERIRAVPGVTAAGATSFAPLTAGAGEPQAFTVPGQPRPAPGEEPRVTLQPASPGYLAALGVPLVAGRDIDAAAGDSAAAPVAVISRSMAERFWPGRSPVGETFDFRQTPFRVVGVVGDLRSSRLDSVAGFTAYVPDRVMPRKHMSVVVRTNGDPAQLARAVQAAIREVVPGQAFEEVVPLGFKLSEAARTPRFFTVLVTVFGVLALVLAAVGLYGVVAYVVRQREPEMGVRLALGAPPSRVLGLMLRQGMTPVVVGLAIGITAALAVTRVLRSMLFEVSATDPATLLAGASLLAAVALVASYVPSRRAARVDPAAILRGE